MNNNDVDEMCGKLKAAFGRRLPDITIDEMVNRFLCWKLPQDFTPDGGITFDAGGVAPSSLHWPVGTNLLTASQAKEMIEHVIFGESMEVSSNKLITPEEKKQKPPVVTVESSDQGEFEERCKNLINEGYRISSTSCGFVNSQEYDFCSTYHAVFVGEGEEQ